MPPLTTLAMCDLQNLSTLLPHLTRLGVLDIKSPLSSGFTEQPSVFAACIALRACPKLLTFEARGPDMTAELWAAWPAGLTSCITPGTRGARRWDIPIPPLLTLQQHTGLHTLDITKFPYSLKELALYLTAALSLAVVKISLEHLFAFTRVTAAAGLTDELRVVDARVGAGLQFLTEDAWGNVIPTHVCVDFYECQDVLKDLSTTANMMPFTNLHHLRFNLGGRVLAELSQPPRLFPSLRELTISETTLDEGNLTTLASCAMLALLDLKACWGLTHSTVAALCAASTSLVQLRCFKCREFSDRDGRAMGRKGWAGTVRVSVD